MKLQAFIFFFIVSLLSGNLCFCHEEMKTKETTKKNYTLRDIKNIKTLSAICSIGPLATTLALGTEDWEELILGARLGSTIHSLCNSALEDYDLLSALSNYLNQLSHLQINKSMNGFLSLRSDDTDAIEDLQKASINALIKELGTQTREFFLRKALPDINNRIKRRFSRIILTSIGQAIFDYIFHHHMHSIIPTLILGVTEQICGEFLMRSIEWKGLEQKTIETGEPLNSNCQEKRDAQNT